jgi:hypothetical protein
VLTRHHHSSDSRIAAIAAAAVVLAAAAEGGCGSSKDGGISCAADSVCQPACAADPDCGGGTGGRVATGGSTGTGGATASGGSVGSGGGAATGGRSGSGGGAASGGTTGSGGRGGATGGASGTGGRAATGGSTGTGGGGGQAGCGGQTISGSVMFTGVTSIAFDRISTTARHKRDVDAFEDGCLNRIELSVGYAAGCTMTILATNCLDGEGRMRVTNINFSADSQCPNFPDAIEGAYTQSGVGTTSSVSGSSVRMSAARVPDRNVATSCVQERFEISLAGTINDSPNTLTFGAGSTLVVTGTVRTTELDQMCPTACPGTGGAGGAGGRGGTGGAAGSCQTDANCSSALHCYRGSCVGPSNYGPCSAEFTARHCPSGTVCLLGFCSPACDTTACPAPTSGTAAPLCSGDCFLDCRSAQSTCPTGMTCTSGVCVWPP